MTFGGDPRSRSSRSRAARLFRIHCARRSDDAHAVPVRATALLAGDSSGGRGIVPLSRPGLAQAARTADTPAGPWEREKADPGFASAAPQRSETASSDEEKTPLLP